MEGVGARLGRSSSRYGATTVFSGPVRRWKKKWVTVAPSSTPRSASAHSRQTSPSVANGGADTPAHLLLYKWTPMSQSNKENNDSNNGGIEAPSKEGDTDSAGDGAPDSSPKRKFRYVPVAALEPKKEAEENTDDEVAFVDTDLNASEPTSKSDDGHNEKPDINDVPMEEDQVPEEDETAPERQDLNGSTLNLNVGFTEQDSDSRMEPVKDAQ